jgi:hypothetical protein
LPVLDLSQKPHLAELGTQPVQWQQYEQLVERLAHEAARTNRSSERYLLALAQEEVARQEAHRIERAVANAHFPVRKRVGGV